MLTANTIKQKVMPHLYYSGKYGAWRIIYIVIIGILFLAGLFTIYFIYQNINTALSSTAVILNLKSNVQFEIIDISAYKNAAGIIEKKKNTASLPPNLRNIFEYSIGSISASSSCDDGSTNTTTISAGSASASGANTSDGRQHQSINKC